jgi:hypothetical protein
MFENIANFVGAQIPHGSNFPDSIVSFVPSLTTRARVWIWLGEPICVAI